MIELADFGRTGHRSGRVIFGAAGLGWASQETADQVLAVLLEYGVNHLDTASSYGDSELRLAPWLVHHRKDFFLATKTDDRTGDGARASLGTLARPSRCGQRRSDPAAQPGRTRRMGDGPRSRWRRRSAGRAARRGPGPVHRRDGPRAPHRGHAPEESSSASTSTRSCCRTTVRFSGTPPTTPTSSRFSRSARSGEWRSRRSSRSPVAGGPRTTTDLASAGTSRFRRAMPSHTPCGSCSAVSSCS